MSRHETRNKGFAKPYYKVAATAPGLPVVSTRLTANPSVTPGGGVLIKKSSMPKRLTDTGQWRDPWFRKLSPKYKSFWFFMCAECDLAGVWKEDFEMASFLIGEDIEKKSAYSALNDGKVRVQQLKDGYTLITDFVPFQYGALGSQSPIHLKVQKLIESHRVSIGYPIGYGIPCKENKNKKENKDLRKSHGSVLCGHCGRSFSTELMFRSHLAVCLEGSK